MKNLAKIGILFSWLLLSMLDVYGQCDPTRPPTMDAAGNITSGEYPITNTDPNTQRIIDARPNRVFAATGKTRFGKTGKVVIANMNPFLFEGYRISIQEEEIKEEALVKFAKALIPIAGDFVEIQRQERTLATAENEIAYLEELKARLTAFPTFTPSPTPTPSPGPSPARSPAGPPRAAYLAVQHMFRIKGELERAELEIRNYLANGYLMTTTFATTKERFIKHGDKIFDRDTDTIGLCDNINLLLLVLDPTNAYPSQTRLKEEQERIEAMVAKAKALKQAVDLYNKQNALKDIRWIGSTGFDYVEDLGLFADELSGSLNTRYSKKVKSLSDTVGEFDKMKAAIKNVNTQEATLLQQEFPIGGKYDFSKVTVTVQPFGEKTPADPEGDGNIVRNGDAPAGNTPASGQNGGLSSPPNTGSGAPPPETARARRIRFAEAGNGNGKPDDDPPATPAGPATITDFVTTGKPRFEIGVGMAYSHVEKQKFQVVSGFVRDRAGNLTNGETFTNVVGFSEQTDHRFTPVALLHTRLTNNPKHNLYFSLGITGSRDQLGTNIEYLIGPSVNITDNIFITAGAFAARQHQLAGDDLFVNAGVPEGFDAIPVRSRYRWKPGFSFSYRLPITGGSSKKSASAESGAALDTYTDTVYVGQPRFSISAGMAYSPLRQQSFQPIIGFARDRDGALTNGETFTSVVGFNENSDGRFLPMALLNTRIASNDKVGLHFSLGITAKRTDENTHVEYLIGPSFSFMKNQIIFTAGAYAGKQEKIAGDLFVNAPLASGITLTTQTEYRFKPGIAFSYRLPVNLP